MTQNNLDFYEEIQRNYNRRYRLKKTTNLVLSALIAFLGITSFLYGLTLESIPTIFRWMTVDGTLFTTASAIAFIAVNLVEILAHTELTRTSVYYIRLSSAVAESIIFIVVIVSQLPFFPEHLPVSCHIPISPQASLHSRGAAGLPYIRFQEKLLLLSYQFDSDSVWTQSFNPAASVTRLASAISAPAT